MSSRARRPHRGRRARARRHPHPRAARAPEDDPAVASLGIVPVEADDPGAPRGCAALRELVGLSLLHRAVAVLTASGVVHRVVVAVPPALEGAVRDVVRPMALGGLEVLPVQADGPGNPVLATALLAEGGGEDIIVVHDPLHPLASAVLVRAVVQELAGEPEAAAAAPARPVTDTLKWVDDDIVRGTADRGAFRLIGSPQAYRRRTLLDALAHAAGADLRPPGTDVLPRLVAARGGRVLLLPAGGEDLRIATEDDLLTAEALLHSDGDLCREIGVVAPE